MTPKFRFFQRSKNQFYSYKIFLGHTGEILTYNYDGTYQYEDKDDFIVDQWSGCVDREGFRIYTNDLLKCPTSGIIYIVEFGAIDASPGVFSIRKAESILKHRADFIVLSGASRKKIIGNIHLDSRFIEEL